MALRTFCISFCKTCLVYPSWDEISSQVSYSFASSSLAFSHSLESSLRRPTLVHTSGEAISVSKSVIFVSKVSMADSVFAKSFSSLRILACSFLLSAQSSFASDSTFGALCSCSARPARVEVDSFTPNRSAFFSW